MKTFIVIAAILCAQVCALKFPNLQHAQQGVEAGFNAAQNSLDLAHNLVVGNDESADSGKFPSWNPIDIGLHIAETAVQAAENIAQTAIGAVESAVGQGSSSQGSSTEAPTNEESPEAEPSRSPAEESSDADAENNDAQSSTAEEPEAQNQ